MSTRGRHSGLEGMAQGEILEEGVEKADEDQRKGVKERREK